MALAPYPRAVARVLMPTVQRWPDLPVGAVRQATLDVSDWADQIDADPPTSVTATVEPDDGGLALSGAAVDGSILGVTLTPAEAGIGTDYAVLLTASTAGGRAEPFAVRILVTDPLAEA